MISTNLHVVAVVVICLALATAGFPPPDEWCKLLPSDEAKNYKACPQFKASAANPSSPAKDRSIITDPILPSEWKILPAADASKPLVSSHRFEGDILGIDPNVDLGVMKQMANFMKNENSKWPWGVVVYQISKTYRPTDRKAIRDAMDVFQQRAQCVTFRERKPTDSDYLYIAPGPGCFSYAGRQGGQQMSVMQIGACTSAGIIQHELMHTIGFYHEQSRTDRDEYVDINWDNLSDESRNQFQKYSEKEVTAFGEPYDFSSIMHYGKYDFAKDPSQWTIKPKRNEQFSVELGQRAGLSEIDVKKIKLAYCPTPAGPCPGSPGWKKFNKKCYYFSFLADTSKLPFAQARNFCRKQLSLIANPLPNVVAFLADVMRSSLSKIGPNEPAWTANCQSINSMTRELQDSDCYLTLDFICEMTAAATV